MAWALLSLLTALFESFKDVLSKKSLAKIDEYTVSLALRLFALPFLLPLLFFSPMPDLSLKFWLALICGCLLNVITTVLYMKALKFSDLSLTVPFITFTPLFLLLSSPLMVGEFPDVYGLSGVFLIVTGSYIINIKECNKGLFSPFRALVKLKGPRYMLMVAFIWSITANIDKIGISHSSVVVWAFFVNVFAALILIPVSILTGSRSRQLMREKFFQLFSIGFINACKYLFQLLAIQLTLVVYVISVKRMSAVFGVIFGVLVFHEKGLTERLTGVLIMLAGVLLICL